MARPLDGRSSSEQLWKALQAERAALKLSNSRLEALGGSPPRARVRKIAEPDPDELQLKVRELEEEIERATARTEAQTSAIEALQEGSAESGIAEEGQTIHGKPAMREAATIWRRYQTAVRNIPLVYVRFGNDVAIRIVEDDILTDLTNLEIVQARGTIESSFRRLGERLFRSPVFQPVIIRPGEGGDILRSLALGENRYSLFRPTLHAIWRATSEQGVRDNLGLVVK